MGMAVSLSVRPRRLFVRVVGLVPSDPDPDEPGDGDGANVGDESASGPRLEFAGADKRGRREKLEALARELGVEAQVEFLGLVRDVPQRLMAQRICVLSTHYEGMPLALIEGMAAGCAVIGSAVPGVREVLSDGEDGLLVPESDPVAMADALERLLRDEAFAARLGAAARRTAIKRHGRALMNQRYEDLFVGLAGR